jgi:predicted ATPase/class 3 adenylate cyclase
MPISNLPTGTVTFLFTDVEGSTKLWERHPDQTRAALIRHDEIIEETVARYGGSIVRPRGEGDSRFAVFSRATDAVTAAAAIQQALYAEPWHALSSKFEVPGSIENDLEPGTSNFELKVRMALHTGEADLRQGDYYGIAVNRCSRLRSVAHGGQVLLSRTTFDLIHESMPIVIPGADTDTEIEVRDLGEHLLKDLQQPQHIFQLVIPSLPADFPQLKTLDARPNNLPTQRSPLVGRMSELAAVERLLLGDDVGLLTLTGPGGIGKTRLGLKVAAELLDEFQDGVFFVSLAHITDPNSVASVIAQTLGMKEGASNEIADSLTDYLSDKQLLLLLDNFEQVVTAALLVARIVSASPRLKVLVTSREVLHVHDEQEFAVPPLGVPDIEHLSSLEALSQYEAVALFIQRARLVKADFEVTNENAPAVAEICYRLDGLPLAIELAAARIRLLPPQAILSRLASRLQLLTAGGLDVPERQQTLRSTMQWSYDLLQPGEQMLFRRMSVFTGGSTLEAIEAVCAGGNRSQESGVRKDVASLTPNSYLLTPLDIDILGGVGSLVDKSLMRQESNTTASGTPTKYVIRNTQLEREPRFGMLETMREYGRELLEIIESAEGEEIYRRHAQYYMTLAEQGREGVQGPQQELWLDRLEAEHDNVYAAMKWAVEQGDSQTALRLGGSLWIFRGFRAYLNEGYQLLREALRLTGAEARDYARAIALRSAALMSRYQRDVASSRAYIEESIAIFRELGPEVRGELGITLVMYGSDLAFSGEQEATKAAVKEGIALLRQAGNKWYLSDGLFMGGFAATVAGDPAAAKEAYEESITICREVGNTWILSHALNSLGDLSRLMGDYARARETYQESLSLFRRLDAKIDIPASIHNLGHVALALGEVEEAKSLFIEALRLHKSHKNRAGVAECLAGLAAVAGSRKQPERAARLFGAATLLRGEPTLDEWTVEQVDYKRNLASARAQLDEARWAAAWQEGRAMTMEEAINYSLERRSH